MLRQIMQLKIPRPVKECYSKVESINVEQGIFGRIFDFGTLVINGTGGGKTPIPSIDSPLEFRKNAMQAIDAMQS